MGGVARLGTLPNARKQRMLLYFGGAKDRVLRGEHQIVSSSRVVCW